MFRELFVLNLVLQNLWLLICRLNSIACRSTPVKPAVNPYQQKRHPKTQNETQIFILNIINTHVYFHLLYMYTDPYYIRITIPDRPNQTDQTRPTKPDRPNQTDQKDGTESLRNKRIFTEYFNLKCAIFISIYLLI